MKLKRENWIRYGALTMALVVVLLSLVLWILMREEGQLEVGFSLPRVSPTPQLTSTPTPAQLKVTAAPTPILVQVDRNYPPEALDVAVEGKVLFTVEDADAAQEALERYLYEEARSALQPNERLIRAGFDQDLTLQAPSGQGELLTVDEAVNTLKADDNPKDCLL